MDGNLWQANEKKTYSDTCIFTLLAGIFHLRLLLKYQHLQNIPSLVWASHLLVPGADPGRELLLCRVQERKWRGAGLTWDR